MGRDDKGQLTGEVGSSPAIWMMVRTLDLIQKEAVDWDLPKHMLELIPPDFCGSSDEQHSHK